MIVDFSGFANGVIGKKLPSDKTLNNMRKSELIKLLHIAQNNYDSLKWFYNNAVQVNMEELKDKWVNVKDRLPTNPLEDVIGWDYFMDRCCFVRCQDGRWTLASGNEDHVLEIVAWMPTPKYTRD